MAEHGFINAWLRDYGLIICISTRSASNSLRRVFAQALGFVGPEATMEEVKAVQDRLDLQAPADVSRLLAQHHPEVIAFVRDPVTRIESAYNHFFDGRRGRKPQTISRTLGLSASPSFEEFVERACATPDKDTDSHVRGQVFNAPHRDHVFRLEELDWGVVQRFFSDRGLVLPPLRKTHVTPPRKSLYTPALIRKVRERYRDDCEEFGYTL